MYIQNNTAIIYVINNISHCRLHDYEAIWIDLRTLSQIWQKVLIPSATEFNNGASRCIYILVSFQSWDGLIDHTNIIIL